MQLIFMVGRFAESERQGRRAFLLAATHSLAGVVETELDKYFVISNALAHSRSLRQGDLTEFGRTASEILNSLPDAWLVVSTPDGRKRALAVIHRHKGPTYSADPSEPGVVIESTPSTSRGTS